MDEKELVIQCKQQNKDAYRDLYETYSEQMMSICLRYTGSEDLAHDVLHDGFIKVFISITSFQYRGKGSLRAWISRIIVNTALAFLNKNEMVSYVSHVEEFEEPEEELEMSAYESVSYDTVIRFIGELPLSCRTVFNLFMFEDFSHIEIGKQLGIKEVASRVRLSRAKSLLINRIKEYIKESGK